VITQHRSPILQLLSCMFKLFLKEVWYTRLQRDKHTSTNPIQNLFVSTNGSPIMDLLFYLLIQRYIVLCKCTVSNNWNIIIYARVGIVVTRTAPTNFSIHFILKCMIKIKILALLHWQVRSMHKLLILKSIL
jgi:hypothetical protein